MTAFKGRHSVYKEVFFIALNNNSKLFLYNASLFNYYFNLAYHTVYYDVFTIHSYIESFYKPSLALPTLPEFLFKRLLLYLRLYEDALARGVLYRNKMSLKREI